MERWSCRRCSRRPTLLFTATLTDIDNGKTDNLTGSAVWQWSKSLSKSGWADIDKATSSSCTRPTEDGADSGYYLRATAKYKDKQSPSGADNDKTASMVSANKVLKLRGSNEAPEFAAVQDPYGHSGTGYRRGCEENCDGDRGGRVNLWGIRLQPMTDDAADVLTYTLVDEVASANFVIDRATGQISVAKSAEFNVTDRCQESQVWTSADIYTVHRHCHRP